MTTYKVRDQDSKEGESLTMVIRSSWQLSAHRKAAETNMGNMKSAALKALKAVNIFLDTLKALLNQGLRYSKI